MFDCILSVLRVCVGSIIHLFKHMMTHDGWWEVMRLWKVKVPVKVFSFPENASRPAIRKNDTMSSQMHYNQTSPAAMQKRFERWSCVGTTPQSKTVGSLPAHLNRLKRTAICLLTLTRIFGVHLGPPQLLLPPKRETVICKQRWAMVSTHDLSRSMKERHISTDCSHDIWYCWARECFGVSTRPWCMGQIGEPGCIAPTEAKLFGKSLRARCCSIVYLRNRVNGEIVNS